MSKRKIYIAGPGVFVMTEGHHERLKNAVRDAGFIPLYPLDNILSCPFDIKKANQDMILEADIVVADISPFRGVSADPGTSYEIGFAEALGKPVYRYSDSHSETYANRVIANSDDNVEMDNGTVFLAQGMEHSFVENFGATDNLMFGLSRATASPEDKIYPSLTAALQAIS